ncbi:MAG: hypothetical protein AB8B87_05485 [Granulosicoccus sp.]
MTVNPTLLTLRPVTTSDADVNELFSLLQQRQFGISHRAMPSYDDHKAFVLSHPYRGWFIVQQEQLSVGSVYLLESNHIGINMLAGYASLIKPAIDMLCDLFQPLPGIASVRSARFVLNVAPRDTEQIDALESAGAVLIQQTYQLP